MFTSKNLGFSNDFIKSVNAVINDSRNMTRDQINEHVKSGLWSIEYEVDKTVAILESQSKRRFTVNVIDEASKSYADIHEKKLDPVNKKELKGSHSERKDKDIDNDGDVDKSDEYLHRRRKAIKNSIDTKPSMKEELDLDEVAKKDASKHHVKVGELVNLTNPKATPRHRVIKIVGDKAHVKSPGDDKIKIMSLERVKGVKAATWKHNNMNEDEEQIDEISKKTLGSYVKKASHDIATKSAATGRYSERANSAEDKMKKTGDYSGYTQKRKDDETADKMFNKSWKRRLGVAKAVDKLTKEEMDLDEGFINIGGAKVKDDEKSILQHIKKTFPNVNKVKKDPQHGWIPVFEEMEIDDSDRAERARQRGIERARKKQDEIIRNRKPSKQKNESVEIDEISTAKINYYVSKARSDTRDAYYNNEDDRISKRNKGISLALKKKWGGKVVGTEEPKVASRDENYSIEEAEAVKRGRGRPRKDAASDDESSDGDRHIVMQMRKAVSLNGNHVVFNNGDKKHISRDTAQGFLNKYSNLDKSSHKEVFSNSAIKSHEHFKNALAGKVEKPKSGISMPKLKSDVMDKK